VPERIQHPDLPEEILVSYEPVLIPEKGYDIASLETHAGSSLLRYMARTWLAAQDMKVLAPKSEKPRAFIQEEEISVSFSHTKEALSAAMSKRFNVGCDMESVGRDVNPKLIGRMKQAGENDSLYNDIDPIRIWTFKESALKMIGTGLRKPMNSVKVTQINSSLFHAEFTDGKQAKICSFKHNDHWISICYEQ
jgi:phosphopantetheinyl transferase